MSDEHGLLLMLRLGDSLRAHGLDGSEKESRAVGDYIDALAADLATARKERNEARAEVDRARRERDREFRAAHAARSEAARLREALLGAAEHLEMARSLCAEELILDEEESEMESEYIKELRAIAGQTPGTDPGTGEVSDV